MLGQDIYRLMEINEYNFVLGFLNNIKIIFESYPVINSINYSVYDNEGISFDGINNKCFYGISEKRTQSMELNIKLEELKFIQASISNSSLFLSNFLSKNCISEIDLEENYNRTFTMNSLTETIDKVENQLRILHEQN